LSLENNNRQPGSTRMTAGGYACSLMGGLFYSIPARKPLQQQRPQAPNLIQQKQQQQQQASDL
jgi:hypothetical protein